MKRIFFITLVLAWTGISFAQNNPYGIDDECYEYFAQADILRGKPGFKDINEQLLLTAREKGDTKAETLYYVEALKDLTSSKSSPDNDKAVDEAQRILKEVSRKYGFPQYFYYSYEVVQTYYHNNGMKHRTLELLQEMQKLALEEDNAFGLWSSGRYLASLFIAQSDYVSAKPYLIQAINVYNKTDDPTVKKQSPTRLYCELADTYPIGTDSVHINVQKALLGAKQHLDTLRCRYYQARLAALDGDIARYKELRDYCMADPQMLQVTKNADTYFSLIDAVFDGTIAQREKEVVSLHSIREMKVIANLCENQDPNKYPDYKDFAFNLEKKLVERFERSISSTTQSHLTELDVAMDKAALSADLRDKEHTITQISHWMLILLSILLGVLAVFFWSHLNSLKKRQKKDQQHIKELQEANEKVRLADAAKTRFVQNMSHEVRTPLNAIVGFSQLLSLPDGALEPQEKEEFAHHIVNNTQMLTMLLDDILNISAMDNGGYRIVYSSGEMHFMAQEAISSAEHRLQPGVKMYYVPEKEEPFTFTTDPRRVQQILINLLTNACKQTTAGEIRLTSSLEENPGYVTFAVTDTGPGVAPENAEKIFERFTKLNEFVQGTGLGLSICRDIAGRMGAKVFLDTSYTAGGARFVFMVPIEPPQTNNPS
ncbi:MAG: HAMP domain-containing histidine kinase [Bacteroidales bacterium]|nr:HAMP domain-containing histidine kinase [Bacteroidales bacterium]